MTAKLLPVGNGFILILNEEFATGYQAGHLTYMAAMKRHPEPYTDEYIVGLMLDQLENMQLSSSYGVGFIVGWLTTLAKKGMENREAPALSVAIEGISSEEKG